jgi:ABC-type transport system involved in multi-copper enzyme maturation permease subunit
MKFVALLKKELRESLPFITVAAVLLFVFGYLILSEARAYETSVSYHGAYPHFKPASTIGSYDLRQRWSPIRDVGPLVFIFSIALGLAIGIRQFWVAFYSQTWDFEICRPAKRAVILAAKLTTAIIGFVASVGLVWTLTCWYASQQGIWFTPPPTGRIFIEGWFLIALGFVVYLGVALAGLSTRRWYTTKMFSLGFVLFVFIACFCDWRLWLILIFMIVGVLVLLLQTTEKFLNRQF